jgi:adenylylsulfate reductase subunit B
VSVFIDQNTCLGCGHCLNVCPGDLITLTDRNTALINEPERCWSCAACLKSCPHGSLKLFLSPSLGGRGLLLTARLKAPSSDNKKAGPIRWTVSGPDHLTEIITDPIRTDGY